MEYKNFCLRTVVLLLLSLCACFVPEPIKERPSFFNFNDKAPKRVVVMPFYNRTSKEGLEKVMRESFYDHFSSKKYYDIELYEVDNSIKHLEKFYAKPWSDIPVRELGNFFNADLVIYGEVKVFRRLFLLFYSQMTLLVKIEMVDAMSGKAVFSETMVKNLYSGDIPFNPFSVFSATLRSGLNLTEKRIIILADKLSRAFVQMIPEPPCSAQAFLCVNVQVASFLEKERAVQTLKDFEGKGLDLRIEEAGLENNIWYRVVAGPYTKEEAEKTKEAVSEDKRFEPVLVYSAKSEK